MNTEKMTVHRALAELKTLDSRIQKKIKETTFCIDNRHNNTKINGIDISEVAQNIKDNFASIKSLISRRNAIKRAVALSNATTEVTIGGKKYRVAEAIEMKNHGMDNYKILLTYINKDIRDAQNNIVSENSMLERKATDYVIGLFGSRDKVNGDDAEKSRETYIKANTYELIDPVKVLQYQSELSSMISDFETEVDSALSVSNAITEIEISYEV